MQQQNNFESLTVEEKIVNIKNRVAELKMRLNHKSGNVQFDPSTVSAKKPLNHALSSSSAQTSTSQNQYASEADNLKAKLLGLKAKQ